MPAKFTCQFTMDSAAFHDPDGDYAVETISVLTMVAARVGNHQTGGAILDTNGKKIGSWKIR